MVKFPFHVLPSGAQRTRPFHDRFVPLVDEMFAMQREPAAARRAFDDARGEPARRIAAVNAAIDQEVYALYGLTEEEIALAEDQKRVVSAPWLCYNCVGGREDERSHRD